VWDLFLSWNMQNYITVFLTRYRQKKYR